MATQRHPRERIGEYTLVRRLGAGGFGEVWEAASPTGPVALKFLQADWEMARPRFVREIEALKRLDHPGCVRLLDYGTAPDGTMFLVTELVDGVTLDRWLEAQPSKGAAQSVAKQLCDAVAHAHRLGLLHRDLKPMNILVGGGAEPRVKVLDFGIAKISGIELPDITKTGEVMGTPGYMSPEQLRGARDATAAADVYSLGVILFELLERRHPFNAPTALELAMKHLAEPPPPIGPEHAPQIRGLIAGMLAKEAGLRPRLPVVRRTLDGEAYRERSIDRERPTMPEGTSRRTIALALVAIGAIAGLLVIFRAPKEPEKQPPRVRPELTRTSEEPAPVAQVAQPPPVAQAEAKPCQKLSAGRHALSRSEALTRHDVPILVPPSYGDRPLPLVVFFHDVGQVSENLFDLAELRDAAADRQFVVAAPAQHDVRRTWTERDDFDQAEADVRFVIEELCVDPERVYVIGHGNGGLAAEHVACTVDGVVGLAQSSLRYWGWHRPCASRRVPRIVIGALADPAAPVEGGKVCGGASDIVDFLLSDTSPDEHPWPLARQEAELRKAYQCAARTRHVYKGKDGECTTASCATELVWCRAEGGRDWAPMQSRLATVIPGCASVPGEFDHLRHILEFFDRIGGLQAVAE